MKEVENKYKSSSIKLDKSFLLVLYKSIKHGKNPSTISKELNIDKTHINYYISSLKKQGLIEKIGYGTWKTNDIIEVKQVEKIKSGSLTSRKQVEKSKQVRGHAFVWKIKIPKRINWKVLLETKGLDFKLVNGSTPRVMIKGKKIWLGQKNVIIYDLESYFGANAVETKKYAIARLLEIISALEIKLGISLKQNDLYTFTVARNHYSLIKNCLAIQCNKNKQKIQVSNDQGMWFIIDNSYNLDEAETIHPEKALIDNLGVQKYFNEHKETNFEVTPKFILNGFAELTGNLNYHAENIKSHIKAIQDLGNGVQELTKVVKEIKEKSI